MKIVLKKIALYEDRAEKSVIERYRFKRSDGKTATIDLPPSVAADGRSLRAKLLDGLTASASDLKALSNAIATATKATAQDHYIYEKSTGWTRNNNAFVLQSGLVGMSSGKIIGIAPVAVGRGKTSARGTSEQWTDSVATCAEQSTTMMFAVATAFAAPLLKVANEGSFGICLFGRTRGGKTMATLAAGSVIGIGKDDRLLNWYSTTAGLEPYFPAFNDCLFPIDDLSKLPAKTEHQRYSEVRDLAYKAIGGDIKGRHPSFAKKSGRTSGAHYRFIVLTSFEKSIQDLATESNQARMGGEAMRLLDVPAYFDDLEHIFDRVPKSAALTQEKLRKLFSSVLSSCAENYGHVFRQYLQYLIAHRHELRRKVLNYQRAFCDRVSRKGDGNDAADLARKFGLIYAGGRIAISGEVLPWKNVTLLGAIEKCYYGARELLVDDTILIERGRELLRSYLMKLPKLDELKKSKLAEVPGFVERQEKCYRCVLRADAFGRIFGSRHQQNLVMAAITQEGKVTLGIRQSNKKVGAQEQFIWPDGKRVRSYEIKWPRKTD